MLCSHANLSSHCRILEHLDGAIEVRQHGTDVHTEDNGSPSMQQVPEDVCDLQGGT